jgi:hypothetical protein
MSKPAPDKLLRYPEAAAYLGLTVNALRARVCRGDLKPTHRSKRTVWFTAADLATQLSDKSRR